MGMTGRRSGAASAAFLALAVSGGQCGDDPGRTADPIPPPSDLEVVFEAAVDALEIDGRDEPVALSPLPPYDELPTYFTRFPGPRRWAWGRWSLPNQEAATAAWREVVERHRTADGWVTLEGPSDPPPRDGDALMLALRSFRPIGTTVRGVGDVYALVFDVTYVRHWEWIEVGPRGESIRAVTHDEWSRVAVTELPAYPRGFWLPSGHPGWGHTHRGSYSVRVERGPSGEWSGRIER